MEEDPLFHAARHEAWEAFALAHFPDVAPAVDFARSLGAGAPPRRRRLLDRALAYKPPLTAFGHDVWRR